ncbi:12189_t:CDS:2, partial [Dentiscutata heterogama]
ASAGLFRVSSSLESLSNRQERHPFAKQERHLFVDGRYITVAWKSVKNKQTQIHL